MYAAQGYLYRTGIDNILTILIGGVPIAMPTVLSVTLAIGAAQVLPSPHTLFIASLLLVLTVVLRTLKALRPHRLARCALSLLNTLLLALSIARLAIPLVSRALPFRLTRSPPPSSHSSRPRRRL